MNTIVRPLFTQKTHIKSKYHKKENKDMEKLIEILKELHSDVDFENEEGLIDNGILDSLDIVTLVTEIDSEFDVRIPPEEIVPENFNSAKALFALIEKLDEA